MDYVKLTYQAGVWKDDTPLAAEGFYIDSDKIRFVRGKWQTIGGWEIASTDAFEGICRGLFVWRDNSAQPLCAIGTHTDVYALYDADLYQITPVVSYGTLTDPITTTSGSAVVQIDHTVHGRAEGDAVKISNAAAVGGITLDGWYSITEVLDADSYTVTHSSAATSTAGPSGGSVDYDYALAIGLSDGLGGLGYGVGGFGLGGFGAGASINELFPRTWSFDNWGQNLVGNPRGGALFEWAPAYTATELVTNGDFSAGTDWTPGTGWSIGSGVATATAGTASNIEQAITLAAGAYFLLEFDYTRTAGTLQPKIGTTNIGDALSAASGRVRKTFFTASGNLIFYKDATFAGTIDNVSVKQILRMTQIPNAPAENDTMLVTAERMVMVGGTIEAATGLKNPLHIRWSDQENNQQWTPAADNTSSFTTISLGSRIVKLLNARGEILVFTDDCMFVGRFVPDLDVVYSFTHLGRGNGLIGPNAATIAGGRAYWIGTGGEFMRYAGGVIEHVPCTVRRDVIDNLAKSQQDKIYAFAIDAFNEVVWLYPDSRDGNECSRYVKYNWIENCWDVGTFDRTAWIDSRAFFYPLAADASGSLYYQEKGNSADGGALSGFIESGATVISKSTIYAVLDVIPDFDDMLGGAQLTLKSWKYAADDPATDGPYNVNADTRVVNTLLVGRQISHRWDWNSAPAFIRTGQMLVHIENTGMSV